MSIAVPGKFSEPCNPATIDVRSSRDTCWLAAWKLDESTSAVGTAPKSTTKSPGCESSELSPVVGGVLVAVGGNVVVAAGAVVDVVVVAGAVVVVDFGFSGFGGFGGFGAVVVVL